MDALKEQVERQLIANVIKDKCNACKDIVFRDAWSQQERIIRFTTPFFRRYFNYRESQARKWKTGDYVIYEVHNNRTSLEISCVLDFSSVSSGNSPKVSNLIKASGATVTAGSKEIILNSWRLTSVNVDIDGLLDQFDRFLKVTVQDFEERLKTSLPEREKEDEIYLEGAIKPVMLTKYERNPKARAACLAAHGTACSVCGIDFRKEYGEEFEGIIEVHHLIPISEIGKEYVVDPVNDLAPVCPNCHTALHSKKDGVYTGYEWKAIRKEQRE